MKNLQHWAKHSSKVLFDSPVFQLEVHQAENPRNGNIGNYYKTKFPNWVNVIALTPEKEVILIKQYRHGTEEIEIEIPGGCIDHGEKPEQAAIRELQEETGYVGSKTKLLGSMKPNPSLQDNYCYSVLITDCVKKGQQQLDQGEDIEVFKIKLNDIQEYILKNKINHAMIIAAFHYFHLDQSTS